MDLGAELGEPLRGGGGGATGGTELGQHQSQALVIVTVIVIVPVIVIIRVIVIIM